jgi:type VI secretion system protein VasL
MLHSDFTRRPISQESPSGISPVRLDEFDEIKRQINNLNKVTGSVSWKSVLELSKTILTAHSKDFRCSCYYTVAATHLKGLSGLCEGLSSILDLCIVYWYSAYPEHSKSNARITSIEWMIENIEKRIRKHKVQADERQVIEAIHQLCLKIEDELRIHYGIKAPSFGRVRRLLSQWLEILKEQEREENAKQIAAAKRLATPEATHSTPMMKVEVNPMPPSSTSSQKSATTPERPPTKSSSLVVSALVAVAAVAFGGHYAYQKHQFESMKGRIEGASIQELERVISSPQYINSEHKNALRLSTVDRLDFLMNDWTSSPIKVSQANTLDTLTESLVRFYPDSSSAQMLRERFVQQKTKLESEFNSVFRRFATARTVFANIAQKSSDKHTTTAYEYSNSLFPLLGRIEYAEKNHNSEELEQSARLLSAYLYKINQLKLIEQTK